MNVLLKRRGKQLLALLLATVLIFSVVPMPTSAEGECTQTQGCTAAVHNSECPEYVVPCTKGDDCAAETHDAGCPKYVVPCTKGDDCAAETHDAGCPKYVVPCTKGDDCAAETHDAGCPKYVVPCTKGDDCAAETHDAECPKYVVPCTKGDDCAAETHDAGCPKYVVPCTKGDDCAAETHDAGCPKYVAPCTKAEGCTAATHDPECPKYVAPCTKAEGCTAATHDPECPEYVAPCTKAEGCTAANHDPECPEYVKTPCTKTAGCSLEDGHVESCVVVTVVQNFLDAVQAAKDATPDFNDPSSVTTQVLVDFQDAVAEAQTAWAAILDDNLKVLPAVQEAFNSLSELVSALSMMTIPETTDGLVDGVNIIQESAKDVTYNIVEGKVVMIANQNADNPIVFENCTFNLAGKTVKISGDQNGISYNNGETATKLFISGNVQFVGCEFYTMADAGKSTTAGYDAAIYFFDGDIQLNNCILKSVGYNGQFLGLYGSSGAVTFDGCTISTEDNVDGWSYAMYSASVLNLKNSTMSATGMTRTGSNINAFYSGDLRTNYDAINIENSTIDFQDNQAGGFAINNVNIHVKDSKIYVNNNLGNACNSGYWIVKDSTIQMNGNRSGHALSCIGFEMTETKLEILHNGYAGVYVQSRDSSLTNCTVDIRCNGEKKLSYSAGDVWLNTHKLTVNGGTSEAQNGSPWLGAVGRTGSVTTIGTTSVVAYDLNSNAVDNLKSDTASVMDDAQLSLNGTANLHTLLLNPFMESAYARGNGEETAKRNCVDLFKTDVVGNQTEGVPEFKDEEQKIAYILGGDTAKIGKLTDAQLSHHIYNWNAGTVKYKATEELYGAMAYPCVDVCSQYIGHTTSHTWSFDCPGTYVYAPLVGLAFDDGVDDMSVTNMPEAQDQITYEGNAVKPGSDPVRIGYVFTGWYADKECKEKFDFATDLTDNWTVVYAGWEKGTVSLPESPEWQITKSKTATNLDENFESKVTLALPAADYTGNLDVAFVLDGSTSADQSGLAEAASALLEELAGMKNLNVKVSVTIFGGSTPILERTGLLDISDSSDLASLQGILTDPSYDTMDGRSGSNLQAGVDTARTVLNGDTSVANADKYLIILSDGGARMWLNNSGEVMSQTFMLNNTLYWGANQDFTSRHVEGSMSVRTFQDVWNASVTDAFEKYAMTEAASNEDGASASAASWQTVLSDNYYYTSLEVATYHAAVSIANAAQSYRVIWVDYPYHSGNYDMYTASFKTWLADHGYVTRYKSEGVAPADVFSAVKDELVQLVDKGSYVVDEIGSGTDNKGNAYNFDFVNDASKLSITVGNTKLTGTPINATSYGFGGTGNPYDFEVTYYPNGTTIDGKSYGECFVWAINVPVTKEEPVKLTYSVRLTNPQTTAGQYGIYDEDGSEGNESLLTNNSATLYPVDSSGNEGTPETFPKPTVSYTVTPTPVPSTKTLSVQKVWDDENDKDGIRPDSVTVRLLRDGVATDKTLTLNAANGWKGSFTVEDDGSTYTVQEDAVSGYTTSIVSGNSGFTITNTHTPTPVVTEPELDDLLIEKTASRSSIRPGRTLKYTIKVTNRTDVDLTDLVVVDDLDTRYLAFSEATAPKGHTLDYSDGRLTWYIPSLEKNKSVTLSISVKVRNGVADGTKIENVAIIDKANGDEIPGPDPSDSVTVTVSNKISIIPETGDTSNIRLWIGVMTGTALVLAVVLFVVVKKKKVK